MSEVSKSTEEQREEERNYDTMENRWETNTKEMRGDKIQKGYRKRRHYYPLSNFAGSVSYHHRQQTQFLKLHWRFFCTEKEVNNKNCFANLILCCIGLLRSLHEVQLEIASLF
jgi:hypothetical protein